MKIICLNEPIDWVLEVDSEWLSMSFFIILKII